jgi:hypothetical protein
MKDEHCEDISEQHSARDQRNATENEQTARAHRREGRCGMGR